LLLRLARGFKYIAGRTGGQGQDEVAVLLSSLDALPANQKNAGFGRAVWTAANRSATLFTALLVNRSAPRVEIEKAQMQVRTHRNWNAFQLRASPKITRPLIARRVTIPTLRDFTAFASASCEKSSGAILPYGRLDAR
jgi:hypothetical protein